jgi:hypothetical protein
LNYSKVNIPPRPPIKSKASQSQLSSRRETFCVHILWSIFHALLLDAFTLPICILFPPSFPTRAAFRAHCSTLGLEWKLPYPVVIMLCAGLYGGTVYNGIMAGWCAAKAFGVGSAIWLEEEWPLLMDRPYLSTSLNEMWGKRYHQVSGTALLLILETRRACSGSSADMSRCCG